MSSPTRWAGVPLTDRRIERRALLIDAAFALFGDEGESRGVGTVGVPASRAEHPLLLRELRRHRRTARRGLRPGGAGSNDEVEAAITATDGTDVERLRAGIAAVLGFSSADPRRGRVLFTEARANPVLTARRTSAQDTLRQKVLDRTSAGPPRRRPGGRARSRAAMYTGAMAELAQQWLAGDLGADLDAVVDYAVRFVLLNA